MNSMKKTIFTAIIISFTILFSHAQRGFIGTAVVGMNLSQIDGDDLSGFTKLGWTGGVKIGYPILEKSDLSLELLFNQKGSNAGTGFGNDDSAYVTLNYLDFPISMDYKDWYVENENYYKAALHAGLAPAYLFSVGGNNDGFSNNVDDYKRVELAYFLGANFKFTKHLGFTLRYTRGLTTISESSFTTIPGNFRAISYFWTFRTEYTF